jgi:hypothetical protein
MHRKAGDCGIVPAASRSVERSWRLGRQRRGALLGFLLVFVALSGCGRHADTPVAAESDARAREVAPQDSAGTHDDPWRRARATVDQPDDENGAGQVHVLYVVASDGREPPALDVDGSLRRSIAAAQKWLAARTGGPKLRFDMHEGALDITYVRLPEPFTERAIAEGSERVPPRGDFARDRLEKALSPTFHAPGKLYLVYYRGFTFGACGAGAWPQGKHAIKGHMTALFIDAIHLATTLAATAPAGATRLRLTNASVLDGLSLPLELVVGVEDASENVTVTAVDRQSIATTALRRAHADGERAQAATRPPACARDRLSRDGVEIGYWEFGALHEIFHTLGIVSPRAPHHSLTAAGGHLNELAAAGTRDLMYSGDARWGCWTPEPATNAAASPCELDPARAEYFQVASPPASASEEGEIFVDLAQSAFLEGALSKETMPPGW